MQHAVVDDPRHGADRIDQHAGRVAGEIAGDVGLGLAEHVVADRRLRLGVGGEQRAHAAALVAGDHHHRAVRAADLLVAAPFGGGHAVHVILVRGRASLLLDWIAIPLPVGHLPIAMALAIAR